MKLKQRLHNLFEGWRYRYGPTIADALVAASTWQATAKLKVSGPRSILIDNNVLGHGVTHETGWIDTGVSMWGGKVPLNTGHAARIPVYADDDKSETYQNICFLPGIVHLAKRGLFEFKTSAELKAEQLHQPMGRFLGYGSFDHSLFGSFQFPSVDGLAFPTLGGGTDSARQQQLERIEAKSDALYEGLKALLGEKNSLDAWHTRTAEVYGIDYFLTMDFRLIRAVESAAKREPLASLTMKIVTPVQLGAIYDLIAMPPRLYSYHGASFKVRTDLNWPNGKRNAPRKTAPKQAIDLRSDPNEG